MGFIATDLHPRGDREFTQAVTGVFQHSGAGVKAVRNIPKQGAHVAVGHVLELANTGTDFFNAVTIE
ncbi:hypothetical protein D3C73_1311740 [compost metagenome]